MRRVFILIAVVVVLGCHSKEAGETSKPVRSKSLAANKSPLSTVPINKLQAAYADTYRLGPDRRCLLAVEDLARIIQGKADEKASAVFSSGHWDILYGKRKIAELRPLANFPDLMTLLSGWAAMLRKEHPLQLAPNKDLKPIQEKVRAFSPVMLMAALNDIDADRAAGNLSEQEILLAAKALTLLSLQTMDRVGVADPIEARTLAVLALAETIDKQAVQADELSFRIHLAYSRHAKDAALLLPTSDPLRAYILGDDAMLASLSHDSGDAREAQFYRAMLAAASKPEGEMVSALGRALATKPELPDLMIIFERNIFRIDPLAVYVLPVVVAEVEGAPDFHITSMTTEPDIADMTRRFEHDMREHEAREGAVFFDKPMYEAYYRGYFYSALSIIGLHNLDRLSSLDAVEEFAASLDETQPGMPAEFRAWYGHLRDYFAGHGDPDSIEKDFDTLKDLGSPPLYRSYDMLCSHLATTSYEQSRVLRHLMPRLDSRSFDKSFLTNVAYHHLADINLTEDLCKSVDETGGSVKQTTWCAGMINGKAGLLEMLHRHEQDPEHESNTAKIDEVFHNLQDYTHDDDLADEFEKAVQLWPDDFDLRLYYSNYLSGRKEYARAAAALQDWVDKHDRSDGFSYINGCRMLAHNLRRSGDYIAAWNALKPVLSSWQEATLIEAAEIRGHLGDSTGALQFARAAVERYPDATDARAYLASLEWRYDQYQEAAKVLQNPESAYKITADDWCSEVAPYFAFEFQDETAEKMLQATAALFQSGVPASNLGCFPDKFKTNGKPDLAFALMSEILSHGKSPVSYLLEGYDCLKATDGVEKATLWLETRIPKNRMAELAFSVLYNEFGDDQEVLWNVVDPSTPRDEKFAWLMRVYGSLYMGPGDPHRNDLINHYKVHSTEWVDAMARYLLGLESAEKVISLADTESKRFDLGFCLALKARSEGRYRDAVDWFRLTIESGEENDVNYKLSYLTLFNWSHQGTVSAVAAKKL